MSEKTDYLTSLPVEIIAHVLKFVNNIDFVRARSWCRYTRTLIDTNPYFSDHIGQYLRRVGKVRQQIFQENKNVFVTGPAGVGKTTMINTICHDCLRRSWSITVLAPTQFAAELVPDGQTIHKFLGSIHKTPSREILEDWYNKYEQDLRCYRRVFKRRAAPDLIIIDECSMVGAHLLWVMDYILRERHNGNLPFGGVRVLMVGDFCQLPPVCDKYAFLSSVWTDLDFVRFNLTLPLRQHENRYWFNYLQQVRHGKVEHVLPLMRNRVIDKETYDQMMDVHNNKKPILLSSDNKTVEELNHTEFNRLPYTTDQYTLHAQDSFVQRVVGTNNEIDWIPYMGEPPRVNLDQFWRCPRQVRIKRGARYMFTTNLDKKIGIINGMGATYTGNGQMKLDNGYIIIFMENGFLLETFKTTNFYAVGGNVYLKRVQAPIRLGWAVTIHKSQGMTLPRVICDLRTIRVAGQYYVAISRVRNRDDLYLYNVGKARIPISRHVLIFYGYAEPHPLNSLPTRPSKRVLRSMTKSVDNG